MNSEVGRLHLIIDGRGADPNRLADQGLVLTFLDEHPEAIGMTKIAPPRVYEYRGSKAEDWGVSGFVLIAESHISIHTFPERKLLNIDIFSCKEFDTGLSTDLAKSVFGISEVEVRELERGLEYESEAVAHAEMVREREDLGAASGS